MKFTPTIRGQHQAEQKLGCCSGAVFPFTSKTLSAITFAAVLALAPLPTFAQHGGGGGGAGAHGGGGGGGGHASGGSGGGHASSSGSSGGHAASAPGGASSGAAGSTNAAGASGGGHWWNPFHSGSSNSNGTSTGTGAASTNATAGKFAANNNTWQAPPAGANGAAVKHSTTGTVAGPHAAIASPPHVPLPRHGRGDGGFFTGYPYYGGYGYGFGLGFGGWYGAYGPCDPFWGCFGYGAGYYGGGAGYGYYGGSFSGYSGADLSYAAADDSGASQEPNPSLFAPAPETTDGTGGQTAGPIGKHVIAVLYLKDGSSYAVTDYWLENGKLHYVASYGGENAIDESQLDLQKTVNENAAQGLTFTLRPGPDGSGAPQQ